MQWERRINFVLGENTLMKYPTGKRLAWLKITVSFFVPNQTHFRVNANRLIPKPVKFFAGKYFSSTSPWLSYIDQMLKLFPNSRANSYNALPTSLLTFSMPPVIEKVLKVRKSIF